MRKDPEAFKQVAVTLSTHFDGLYYVDIETGSYVEFVPISILKEMGLPSSGKNFFKDAVKCAKKCVHPDDLEQALTFLDKEKMLEYLTENDSHAAIYRIVSDGEITHLRHVEFLSEDKKHIVFCAKNVEAEYRREEEQKKNLQSAELRARLDDLTGIRNKNAFHEHVKSIESKIEAGEKVQSFGIVMCDLNDLKQMNDTRGHSFGDEALQSASRMICDVFKHSPVFRVGGDEFVVVLGGNDFKQREKLLKQFREKSESNRLSRTGPVIASGMAIYHADKNESFDDVFKRADQKMYKNKNKLKSIKLIDDFGKMKDIKEPIPAERKRLLDGFFEAMYTIAGGGYVYLNDMRYDFSRWSLPLVDDFGLASEYMYHADSIWINYIHPEDADAYRKAVDAVLCKDAEVRQIYYRARKADGTYVLLTTRGFVLNDNKGKPEYFGGIIVPQ
jgi:diguanylate cyclase (GGDEF)-like protein